MVSVRRITGFGLLSLLPLDSVETSEDGDVSGYPWFEYKADINQESFTIMVRHLVKDITPVELMGFNNTGNICVWPSEEVLAYYVLCNRKFFDDKTVLELGGGMTCLAGLLVAKFTSASFIHLTDGNISSVENVCAIVKQNRLENSSRVSCSVLQWGDKEWRNTPCKYDVIMAADCLFFDDGRKDLVNTMWQLLKQDGTALVTAPRRGSTLDEFINEANKMGFLCDPLQYYNEQVWQRHLKLNINIYEQLT
ncbi:calmodulin-lysine N-methyltransferase [Lycorma delicatula]|uniref:calmodulin-lysine N-methyltransferase n=1 Tax=Lycorma delicatula TaxID=130591 RepID=UPI003F517EA7